MAYLNENGANTYLVPRYFESGLCPWTVRPLDTSPRTCIACTYSRLYMQWDEFCEKNLTVDEVSRGQSLQERSVRG